MSPLCIFQRKVIEWLLNHDPALRPTAQELLKSELLPPPQLEESELHEVLQHTMANINGKAYRTMVGQLFAQNTSPVMDYTYDIDLHKVATASVDLAFLFLLHVAVLCWTHRSGTIVYIYLNNACAALIITKLSQELIFLLEKLLDRSCV